MSRHKHNKTTLWLKSGAVAAVFALSAAPASAAEINFAFEANAESAGALWFSANGGVLSQHSGYFGSGPLADLNASDSAYANATIAAQWDFTITGSNPHEWPPITESDNPVQIDTMWDGTILGEGGVENDFPALFFSHIFANGADAIGSADGQWILNNNSSATPGQTIDPVWTSIKINDLEWLETGTSGTFAVLADDSGSEDLFGLRAQFGDAGSALIGMSGAGSLETVPVPEPGALTLLMLSLSGLVAFRRRNARR